MKNIQIIYPNVLEEKRWSEAEILGSMSWLCLQDPKLHHIEFQQVMAYLLPAIKHKQFVMFYRHEQPIGFVTWAYMSQEAGRQYFFENAVLFEHPDYWHSGAQRWIIQFAAPFGDLPQLEKICKERLFPNEIAISKSRRSNPQGRPLLNVFHGSAVSATMLANWKQENLKYLILKR